MNPTFYITAAKLETVKLIKTVKAPEQRRIRAAG